jgi:hypothetical protein
MNLVKEIQQKNESLVAQRSVLLQQRDGGWKVGGLGSFVGVFMLAPFVLGAVVPFVFVRQGLIIRVLRTVVLPSLIPFFFPQVASRDKA